MKDIGSLEDSLGSYTTLLLPQLLSKQVKANLDPKGRQTDIFLDGKTCSEPVAALNSPREVRK